MPTQDVAEQFAKTMRTIDFAAPDPDGVETLCRWLASGLALEPDDVAVVSVASTPMLEGILSERVCHQKIRLLLVALTKAQEMELVAQQLAAFMGRNKVLYTAAICAVSQYGEWFIPQIVCRNSDGLGAHIRDALSPSAHIRPPVMPSATAVSSPADSIVMDDRVMRMARLAIASSAAVILVGPPGTGKTTLVRKLLQEIAVNPASFGLSRPPLEPKWVTPSDSWTSIDLVGGETADEGRGNRFRLGHVLEAIRQDRWLVLDEVNRGNMDRIFGGMLTWMSGQRVEVGRASGELASPPVILDWNTEPNCSTVRDELLDGAKIVTAEPIKFLAGTDWRLLGTYNGQDAQKVFQFGQAIGRRFARVPIPMICPSDFRQALAPLAKGLPVAAANAILGLYTAHYRTPRCQLGPAIFLKIASYVAAGVRLPQLANAAIIVRKSGPGATTDIIIQLVSEAYLCSAGTWLAQLPPERLAELGKAIASGALTEGEWQWITELLPTLA